MNAMSVKDFQQMEIEEEDLDITPDQPETQGLVMEEILDLPEKPTYFDAAAPLVPDYKDCLNTDHLLPNSSDQPKSVTQKEPAQSCPGNPQ